MRLSATATYRPRSSAGQYIAAHVTPGVRASVEAGTKLVEETARAMAPRQTGALAASITSSVRETAKTVVGTINASAPYAVYVEYGTGIRGASSPGAGKGPYNRAWPGMAAQPFMRPAIDEGREAVMGIFRSEIALSLK